MPTEVSRTLRTVRAEIPARRSWISVVPKKPACIPSAVIYSAVNGWSERTRERGASEFERNHVRVWRAGAARRAELPLSMTRRALSPTEVITITCVRPSAALPYTPFDRTVSLGASPASNPTASRFACIRSTRKYLL